MADIKNTIDGIKSLTGTTEEQISKLKDQIKKLSEGKNKKMENI